MKAVLALIVSDLENCFPCLLDNVLHLWTLAEESSVNQEEFGFLELECCSRTCSANPFSSSMTQAHTYLPFKNDRIVETAEWRGSRPIILENDSPESQKW